MIITKYLVREIFKSQLTILLILLLIFFCQKLIRTLSAVVAGDIPTNLVLSLLGLGLPEILQLILPMSLFLSLFITLSRMYNESEITVMYACGLNNVVLIRAALILSIITSIIAAINVTWISPWSSYRQDLAISEAKSNLSIVTIAEKKFKFLKNGNAVLFIGDTNKQGFKSVFLAQFKPNKSNKLFLAVADNGRIISGSHGGRCIVLNQGTYYEWTELLQDFLITDFTRYQANIRHNTSDNTCSTEAEKMTLHYLWSSSKPEARAEFHWRIAVIISVVIMAMIAVPLSAVNLRRVRFLSAMPAILLYLIFFLLQTSFRPNGAKGKLDPMLWSWLTNVIYLVIALILNLWDSITLRKLRGFLHYK